MSFNSATLVAGRDLVVLVFALFCAQALAAPPAAPAASTTPAQAAPNALTMAIQNIGHQRCKTTLAALSDLGLQGSTNNDVLLDWDRKGQANSPVFALLGMDTPNGGVAMTLNAVPDADGSCSVSADRISVAPVACKAVADSELIGYQRTPLLNQTAVYTQPNDPGSSVSLITVKGGCLVIRRFTRFRVAQ